MTGKNLRKRFFIDLFKIFVKRGLKIDAGQTKVNVEGRRVVKVVDKVWKFKGKMIGQRDEIWNN